MKKAQISLREMQSVIINFNDIADRKLPGMNGGTGEMTAKCTWTSMGK
jgi:hypothetical protein